MTKINANVTETSHADHMPESTLAVVLSELAAGRGTVRVAFPGLAIAEVELPAAVDSVLCSLRGPTTGEAAVTESQAFYGTRGDNRPNLSRLTNLPATQSRTVTVIVVGTETAEDGTVTGSLATAYGGPLAPQEPGDPYLSAEALPAAQAFWATHALSVEGSPTVVEVESTPEAFATPEASRAAVEALKA